MEDWSFPVADSIQVNVSGHDAASLGGLPPSFYLNAANLTGTLDWGKIANTPTALEGYGIIAGTGLTSTGNTINAIGTAGRIVANTDSIDLATVGTAGTYAKATTDAYGRVISGSALLASDIPSLDWAKITTGKPTSLSGYGIADPLVTLDTVQIISGTKTFTEVITSVGGISSQGAMYASSFNGSGSGLTNLNASNLSSGTIPDARLAGNYTGIASLTGSANCTFSAFYVKNTASWDTAAGRIMTALNSRLQIVGIPPSDGGTRVIELNGSIFNVINISSTSTKGIYFSSTIADVSSIRWFLYSEIGTSETGANAGSDFIINAYSDTGVSLGPAFSIKRSTRDVTIASTTASTSTSTGALKVTGGIATQGTLFAQSLNGQLVLNRYTTATRPVASASTLGQVWLNTTTGKIEYVATASTIQSITSE